MSAALYLEAAVAVIATLLAITNVNPLHALLYLIVSLLAVAMMFFSLGAPFAGILEVIVYAGAIMVLFLFVIMLMNLNADTEPQKNKWLKIAGVIAGGTLLLVLVAALKGAEMKEQISTGSIGDIGLIHRLGMVLFSDYVVPFEVSSVLFLSAMVGAVVVGKKD